MHMCWSERASVCVCLLEAVVGEDGGGEGGSMTHVDRV